MRVFGTPLPCGPPGQTTADSPHVMTTIFSGTWKMSWFFFSLPPALRSASCSVAYGPPGTTLLAFVFTR